MRKKRLTELAEWLEAGAPHETLTFDMSTGITTVLKRPYDPGAAEHNVCATSCCIAGAATQFYAPKKALQQLMFGSQVDWEAHDRVGSAAWARVSETAQDLLGLEDHQASRLFVPDTYWGGELNDYSDPQWAARTIRHLIKTGEADWEAGAVFDKKNPNTRQSYLAKRREEETA